MDRLGKVAQSCALAVMLVGFAVLTGWALGIEALKGVLPGLATMKANTALCFVLAGTALALRGRPRVRILCAGAVLAVSGLTLAQELTGADLGIDQLLFQDAPGVAQTAAPGRMSPATAVNFLLTGAALLLVVSPRAVARRAAEALALGSGAMGSVALLGHAYRVEQLYRIPGFSSVPVHTAAAFLVLAAGILCARPDGIAGVFASPGVGGRLARRLLPPALLIPATLGWLAELGQRAGLFGPTQGMAVFASTMMLAVVALIWRAALSLEASDAARARAGTALGESRARLGGIVHSAMDAVITVDAGQRIVLFNLAAERMFGCSQAEALGSPIERFIPPRFRQAHARHIANFARTGETSRAMGRLGALSALRSGGEEFPIEASISQLEVGGQQLFTVILRDVTERLRAERTLRESEERLRLFIEHAPAALAMFDRDMRYVHASHRWLSDFGLGERDLRGLSHYEIFPEIPERWKAVHRRALSGEVVRAEEDRFDRADGSVQWLRWEIRPWYDGAGAVAGVLLFSEDISAIKQTRELIRSAALFPEENPHPVMRTAGDGTLLFANRAAGALLEQWRCAVGDRVPEPVRRGAMRALETAENQELETRCGERELSFVLVPISARHYVNLYGRDVTERKRAEAALRESEERLRLAQQVSHIGTFEWNIQTGVDRWTPELEAMYGLPPGGFAGTQEAWEELVYVEDRAEVLRRVSRALEEGGFEGEWRVVWPDGTMRWLAGRAWVFRDEAARPLRLIGVNIDITERKAAEAALRQYADRLQALSRRVLDAQETERRAIARELHDEIGQVLTAVKINLQSAERRLQQGIAAPDLGDSVGIVEDAIQRVRNCSLDLRPTLLDDLGLIPTIRWYLERQAGRAGLAAEIAAEPLVPRPPPEVETACFRLVQEAVGNAMRHARATSLRVELRARAGHWRRGASVSWAWRSGSSYWAASSR